MPELVGCWLAQPSGPSRAIAIRQASRLVAGRGVVVIIIIGAVSSGKGGAMGRQIMAPAVTAVNAGCAAPRCLCTGAARRKDSWC
jgi:hypothetical protein